MKYCHNCGAQLEDPARFCTRCGTPALDTTKAAPAQAAPVPAQQPPIPPVRPASAAAQTPAPAAGKGE